MTGQQRIVQGFFSLLGLISLAASANAQEGTLRGSVKDVQTGQYLAAELSIIHPARPHVQFFHAHSTSLTVYEMRNLPPGEKILIAWAEGYGFAWQRVVLESGQTLGPIEFFLEKAATIEGQVVDESGLPVAGTTVRIAYQDLPPVTHGWLVPEAETDFSGNFRIRHLTPNRDFHLEASHPRFPVRLSDTSLRAQPGQALTGTVLTLQPGITLTGHIVDTAGSAVPDAEIRLVATSLKDRSPAGLHSVGWRDELHRVASTDASGQFIFEGLAEGKRMLVVRHPQFIPYQQTLDLDRTLTPSLTLAIQLQPKAQ